ITSSARQPLDQPEAETEPSEPPPQLAAAPPEKPQTPEPMPEEWRATAADQLLAFTCCWPELEEPALLPQPTSERVQPPAWPLALPPCAWRGVWGSPSPRGAPGVSRAGGPGGVAARPPPRRRRHNGHDGFREPREVSAIGVMRERPSVRRDNEHLSSRRRYSTGLDESASSLSVLPINEQQHVSLASLVDAPDLMPRPGVRSQFVTR